jgi:CHASE2 domain-containing sensor protein
MWVVIGFFLSISTLKIKGILKGLVISILILLPNLFIIGWKEPISLIPILIMTMILGAISGYLYQKIIKE